jgi:pyruvate kinase
VAVAEGFAKKGDLIVIAAGMPFGEPGTTNLLRTTIID